MARLLVLGAGLGGLGTAALLAADGHEVTVLERDPAEPVAAAWDAWERPGVNQFRLPHIMLPRWWSVLRAELPELAAAVAATATPVNVLAGLPASRRGPLRPQDDIFDTVAARRPVLEAAVAAGLSGVTVRRGVTVTGLSTAGSTRVTGVRTTAGDIPADLVVDCSGRRSHLSAWLVAAGARAPVEERADSGFVYYCRHFRGTAPATLTNYLQHYDSVSVLTLPADHGTWAVVLTVSSQDKALRGLRDPDRWDAALAGYPLAAGWAQGDPITGVDALAGLEDRHRDMLVDGTPVATGVVAVGDAWAATNPSLGRGASMALLHARLLRDLLRETGAGDHEKLARRFAEATAEQVEPLYRAALWFDQHRLAELAADAAGVPYRSDNPAWTGGKALFAASLIDPELCRGYTEIACFLASPAEVLARPGMVDRIAAAGAGAPVYPLPGRTRAELLAAIG
jgi:2-polyprenyl-6-methoxyphenol hydroxylase-like FAD-dependent oxidoreductase